MSLSVSLTGWTAPMFAIARRYHVSPGQMLAANDLPDTTARLDEARRLLVPGG